MKDKKRFIGDGVFSVLVLALTFPLNLLLESWFHTQSLIPMIFVLGVFLISWRTQGYFWGLISSLISVSAVNYAFTYPYYAFDLITPEYLSSAIVMLSVSTLIERFDRISTYPLKTGFCLFLLQTDRSRFCSDYSKAIAL